MSSTIDQYREAKTQYLKLRSHAKKELVARFHELASELYRVQRELLEDFGEKIAIPAKPKNRPAKAVPREPKTVAASEPAAPSPKMISTSKQIERYKTRLAEAQAAGKPTKPIQDRLYELEDELRLLKEQ